ncbi:PAS domain-containing sensor histidine kinase [Aeribacillus pallidus]|uniref:histidine kinase n=1 Tax=Aeribacillus pallidus TaxID=33936 RepID=A0A223E690_9BACI|nr:PAS domain-containing sensor histidine kinase [Aeribacillus pallidus]ASS90787.1 PAS domain-containing sensor histidine kinase [Aeribacillus pallidus]
MKQNIAAIEEDLLTKRLKKAQQENEKLKKYYEIFDRSIDAMVLLDLHGKFFQVNQSACRLFEMEKEVILEKSIDDFVAALPGNEFIKNFSDHEKQQYAELMLKLENGRIKYVEYSIIENIYGTYNLAIFRDVSSKKILELERSINEQLFPDLFDRAVDGIVIFDYEGFIIDANQSFCTSFCIPSDELKNYKFSDFIEDEKMKKYFYEVLFEKGKMKGEMPVRLKDGTRKIFEFTTTSNILHGFYMSILRDITEKRLMEQQILKSEERFREIFENALDAILIWDHFGNIIRANQWACRIFELPFDELLKSNLMRFINANDPKFLQVKDKYLKSGAIREELMFYMPNGQKKQLEFTSKYNPKEKTHMTILRNISDRKRMEKELRESEQKFRNVFNGAMDGILLFNDDWLIVDANPAAMQILGLTQDQIGRDCIFRFFPIHFKSDWKMDGLTKEFAITVKNKQERILECSFKRHIIENMNLVIFRDITERKEIEERLRKSDTLNVVGELAAGIAHEIRNPMTALKGFIQLLQGSIKEDYSMYFNVITSELKRIESIIDEFLILAKPQAVRFEQKNIVKIMKDTIELLNAQAILVNVQIHLDYGEVPDLFCEPNQLKQVFINILKNAIEVMPNGGNIYVSITKEDDHRVQISIQDEGPGIPKNKLKRLGEPFYTTKERGTGLGLMVSYKIIKEHNGKIDVKSKVGYGTTFYISLPINGQEGV